MVIEFVQQFPEWHHVLFKVKDADLSIRFYGEYMGMAAVQDQRDAEGKRCVLLQFSENPYAPLFLLQEDAHLRKSPPSPPSLQNFSFRLHDLKPVEEIAAKAQADKCLVEGPQYGGHGRGYYCQVNDPDGNLLEFAYVLTPKTAPEEAQKA